MSRVIRCLSAAIALTLVLVPATPPPARAASAAELEHQARTAIMELYRTNPAAKELGYKAKGILVFPHMLKAGFMFGGQIGEGVLRSGGRTLGYYNSVAASYGLQAGAQVFGYALFFMSESALRSLNADGGFEIGVGPSVVVVDAGMAKTLTTKTIKDGVYAFVFNQKGLMGGLGIQGSKITRISK